MTGSPKKILEQAKKMEQHLNTELDAIRVEASTGGGMVTVRMDGHKRVIGVVIEPQAAEDIDMLQDMIRGACNEAVKRVEAAADRKMGGVVARLALPMLSG